LQQRNTALEKELEQVREDVRGITEEQEAYNEELQSANEELLSSNEEMQSLNEELETSKEEAQSTNEELIVVNRELIEKQDELNDALDYLDAVIATVREPFLVLEKDFRVNRANSAFYKKFEVEEREIEGRSLFEIQNQCWNHDRLRTMLDKILSEKLRMVDEEIEIRMGAENMYIFTLNASEIIRNQDDKKMILLSIEDITQKKRAQNNLKESVAELQKTNEQLDRYVHLASHDLQEPLRKIMMFSDRLKGSGNLTEEKDATIVNKIEASANRMTSLVKGLLDYSKIAHHQDFFEPTDLNKTVSNVLTDFELLIEEKQAKISVDSLPNIESVPLQMEQIFSNLIGNALKFSKEDRVPEIEISVQKFPEKDIEKHPTLLPNLKYIHLTISDNGIGFDPKYQNQIFTIFQHLHNFKKYEGNGIGLSLVKRIVENHNGTIYATSEKDKGSEFHVILPVSQTP